MNMEFDTNSLLATMNPFLLIGCLAFIVLVAYLCARKYKDVFDFKKSTQLYLIVSLPVLILYIILGIPVIISAGYIISGFIVMAMISNHFFRS